MRSMLQFMSRYLKSHSITVPGSDNVYNVYGATCTEVELDILTGEIQILRIDILHDCGQRYLVLMYTNTTVTAVLLASIRRLISVK